MTETDSTRSHVTRQDRAITDDAWIRAFIQHAPMAVIATVQDQQPFLSTLLFAYDEARHAIYFHTARRGRVWENLQTNPQVCLTVNQMGRMLPAATAFNFSVEYQSVVVFGAAHLLTDSAQDREEAKQALQLLLDKYFSHLTPGQDYRPTTDQELNITAVYRVDIEEWSGKQKAVAEDFPGAFLYQ